MFIPAFISLSRLAIRRPGRMLLLVALLTLAAAPGLVRLKLRTDGHALVSPTAPEVLTDEKIRGEFGLRDQIVVLVTPRGTNGIFNPATLQLVRELTEEFQKIPGVAPQDVLSLATEPSFRLRPGTLTQQKILEPKLESLEELAQLHDDLRRIELYSGTFMALDEKSMVILVGVPDKTERSKFYQQVQRVIAAKKNAENEIGLTGAPVAEVLFGIKILEDLGIPSSWLGFEANDSNSLKVTDGKIPIGLVPLAALVMMIVLLLCFKNLFAAVIPLPGVAATMIFTFGIMGWLGVPVYLTTVVMPVLLTVISATNDIYLFSRYFNLLRERPDENHVVLLEETFQKLTRPIVCTSLCGMAGFLSFAFTPLEPVRMFGLFTALGTFFGLLISLTVVPALLVLVKPKHAGARRLGEKIPLINTLGNGFAHMGEMVAKHRTLVLVGTILLLALTPLGLHRLAVQDSWTNGFSAGSEFRRVTEAVNKNYFGMHVLQVCADISSATKQQNSSGAVDVMHQPLVQPEIIHTLQSLANFIRGQRNAKVGGVLGPADYLATTRFMTRGGDIDSRALTDTTVETKLFWDYYGLSLGPERLRQVVNTNFSSCLTAVFLKDANFQDTARLMNSIRDYAKTNLAMSGMQISFAGDVAVSQSLIGGIVSTQMQSLGWSLIGIFAVTALLGGSWRWGIYCLVPSLLAIIVKFALMGGMNIALGVATAMFAAMTLGIGVNCAIHLLEGFDRTHADGKTSLMAIQESLRFTGPPAFINTLAMSLGFGVLIFSQVPANARLGILLVLGLVNCFAASMILLPALLAKTRR